MLKRSPGHGRPRGRTDSEEARTLVLSAWERDADVWATRWAPVFRAFADEVVRRGRLQSGERVLDVGTGTGTVIELASPLVGAEGRVVGIDRTQAMVARASERAAALGPHVRALRMDVVALEFPDGWFDAVLSSCGIPFLGMGQALAEVRRVLKPGGRFVFSDWVTDQVAAIRILEDVFSKHKTQNPSAGLRRYRDAASFWVREVERLETREKFEGALREAGFHHVRGETITHTVHAFTLESFIEARLARAVAKMELDEMMAPSREAFFREAREALSHLVHGGQFEVLWPIFYLSASK